MKKLYNKNGNILTLKTPVVLNENYSIKGLSRDTNGNALMQVINNLTDKAKSFQYKNVNGMNTIDIDELACGHFIDRRKNDVLEIIDYLDNFVFVNNKRDIQDIALDNDENANSEEYVNKNFKNSTKQDLV